MLDEYGFEIYEENAFPIAYLITFRTYGNWLHGDDRGSNQRRRTEPLPSIFVDPNLPLKEKMLEISSQPPMTLNDKQRMIVSDAIAEVCEYRSYYSRAINVRTNHAHVVVSKAIHPKKIVNDFKVYATRKLRESGEIAHDRKVWSRGASTRYLWKPKHVIAAVEYVLYSQGDVPFEAGFGSSTS